MSIRVDRLFINTANTLVNDVWDEVEVAEKAPTCSIEPCIDHVLGYAKAKTYKYILLTQLLGKAVDERVNILAMKASSALPGAWDARNLCEGVFTLGGFEEQVLHGVLGRTKQPYNNSPGQKPELSKQNHTRKSDIPIRDELIDALSTIDSSDEARRCLAYALWVCKQQVMESVSEEPLPVFGAESAPHARLRLFLRELAQIGQEGEGISLATALLLDAALGQSGCEAVLYQINSSHRGRGDIDVFRGMDKVVQVEIKDRPFQMDEVLAYADSALEAGFPRFAFVYGCNAGRVGSAYPVEYLREGARMGFIPICISFESLLDALVLVLPDVEIEQLRQRFVGYLADANVAPETANPARTLLRGFIRELSEDGGD